MAQLQSARRNAFVLVTSFCGVSAATAGSPVAEPLFTNATADAGLTFVHSTNVFLDREWLMMTPGCAAADFDRDGWMDVWVNGGRGQNCAVFMNNQDGTFTNEALARGVNLTNDECANVAVADVNGDGWLDVYVGTMEGRNYLFMNTGGGHFTEDGLARGVAQVPIFGEARDQQNIFGATFADVDGDGDLDMYTVMWWFNSQRNNRLFINDGTGHFTDGTVAAGLIVPQAELPFWPFTPGFIDMNGDRWPDLLIAADFSTSRYYKNDGDGTFTRVPMPSVITDENGMGAAYGDFEQDGDCDWFITSIFDVDQIPEANWGITGNRLYRNEGNHALSDVTDAPFTGGVREGYWGWGTSMMDFNHDGRLDLVMTNGMEIPPGGLNPEQDFLTDPSRLWLNTFGAESRSVIWRESSTECGLDHTLDGKGLVVFDADNDGDMDVLITSNLDPTEFYRNDSEWAADTWLQIDLIAPPGNAPGGIGAKVEVVVGAETWTKWVHANSTFMSMEPARQHFGFPATSVVDAVRIHWQDGTVSEWTNVAPGQVMLAAFGNVNGDGAIDMADLAAMLSDFGATGGPADLNGDGVVNTADLGLLIQTYGRRF